MFSVIFPGQGSQKVGMAEEILSLEGALERFELASEILGRDLPLVKKLYKNRKIY